LGYCKVKLQKGNPTQTLPKIIRWFHTYYIPIDVSKKALSVFDGKKDLEFTNKEGLKDLKKYLKKKYKNLDDLAIIFGASVYLFPVLN
jgi:hypothetical protein